MHSLFSPQTLLLKSSDKPHFMLTYRKLFKKPREPKIIPKGSHF